MKKPWPLGGEGDVFVGGEVGATVAFRPTLHISVVQHSSSHAIISMCGDFAYGSRSLSQAFFLSEKRRKRIVLQCKLHHS